MPKGSESIFSSISSQELAVSPANNDLMDMWPNLWCNNSKPILFLDGNFLFFDFFHISPKNACFLCALCGKLTTFFYLAPKYTMQNPLLNKQLCLKFINVIMNNMLQISGAKSTLCNFVIKVFPLLSHILFELVLFASTWCDVRPQLQYFYPYLITNLE